MDYPKDHSLFGLGLPGYTLQYFYRIVLHCLDCLLELVKETGEEFFFRDRLEAARESKKTQVKYETDSWETTAPKSTTEKHL